MLRPCVCPLATRSPVVSLFPHLRSDYITLFSPSSDHGSRRPFNDVHFTLLMSPSHGLLHEYVEALRCLPLPVLPQPIEIGRLRDEVAAVRARRAVIEPHTADHLVMRRLGPVEQPKVLVDQSRARRRAGRVTQRAEGGAEGAAVAPVVGKDGEAPLTCEHPIERTKEARREKMQLVGGGLDALPIDRRRSARGAQGRTVRGQSHAINGAMSGRSVAI